VAEAKRLDLSDIPIGTYFIATIDDRAQLCLRIVAGDVLVVSDEPPHLLPPTLGDARLNAVATPTFRPQADGIADRKRKPQFGDILLWSRDRTRQSRVLCAKRETAPPEVFVDLATGEILPLPDREGAVSSVWSKWEALDRRDGLICRFPPRRWKA
jgi:hypothetical protein